MNRDATCSSSNEPIHVVTRSADIAAEYGEQCVACLPLPTMDSQQSGLKMKTCVLLVYLAA